MANSRVLCGGACSICCGCIGILGCAALIVARRITSSLNDEIGKIQQRLQMGTELNVTMASTSLSAASCDQSCKSSYSTRTVEAIVSAITPGKGVSCKRVLTQGSTASASPTNSTTRWATSASPANTTTKSAASASPTNATTLAPTAPTTLAPTAPTTMVPTMPTTFATTTLAASTSTANIATAPASSMRRLQAVAAVECPCLKDSSFQVTSPSFVDLSFKDCLVVTWNTNKYGIPDPNNSSTKQWIQNWTSMGLQPAIYIPAGDGYKDELFIAWNKSEAIDAVNKASSVISTYAKGFLAGLILAAICFCCLCSGGAFCVFRGMKTGKLPRQTSYAQPTIVGQPVVNGQVISGRQ